MMCSRNVFPLFDVPRMKLIVENDPLVVNRVWNTDEFQESTLLMSSISEGATETALMLIESGADVNYKFHKDSICYGITPLMCLILYSRFVSHYHVSSVGSMLIERGADVNAVWERNTNRSVLMMAAREGNISLVKMLVKSGSNVNYKTRSGDTALVYASICNCYDNVELELGSFFLKSGAETFDYKTVNASVSRSIIELMSIWSAMVILPNDLRGMVVEYFIV